MTPLKQKEIDQELKAAVLEGNFQDVERLLWDGADALAGVDKSEDALSCAAQKGHLDILEFLHERAGKKLHKGVLLSAVNNNQLDVLEYLQERQFDILQDDDSGFLLAVSRGHVKMVEYFLESGADMAVLKDKKNHIDDAVKPVLKTHLDKKTFKKQCTLEQDFIEALKTGDLTSVKEICAPDVNLYEDSGYGRALCIAIEYDQLEVVKYLIEDFHMDADACSGQPLQIAAWHGSLGVAKYLVEDAGVNLHGIKNEELALNNAIFMGQKNVTKYLMEKGADLSVVIQKYDHPPKQYQEVWDEFCQTRLDILKAKNLSAFQSIKKSTPAVRRRPAPKQ